MVRHVDVISDAFRLGLGRAEEDEWRPRPRFRPQGRPAALGDGLEVVRRMLAPARRSRAAGRASSMRSICLPSPAAADPDHRGGNGPEVTWRLAARYADELNLDGLSAKQTRDALPIIAARCEELGRDPGSLKISVHIDPGLADKRGARRQELLAAYQDLGVVRVMALLPSWSRPTRRWMPSLRLRSGRTRRSRQVGPVAARRPRSACFRSAAVDLGRRPTSHGAQSDRSPPPRSSLPPDRSTIPARPSDQQHRQRRVMRPDRSSSDSSASLDRVGLRRRAKWTESLQATHRSARRRAPPSSLCRRRLGYPRRADHDGGQPGATSSAAAASGLQPTPAGTIYVKSGDTLNKIATRFKVSPRRPCATWHHESNQILIGQKIVIPKP